MSSESPTVYIETYGCQMNASDSELMLGRLAEYGYRAVDWPDGADVILVNTCAIRDHAEQRVLGRMGELKRHMKPDTVLGVTGCMAQRLGPRLLDRAKHVDLVIGPDGYRALPSLIESARNGERVAKVDFDLEEHYEDFRARTVRRRERVDSRAARLRLPLHLLHRADHARPGAEPRAARCRARGARDRRGRDDRDHAARADRQLVQRRHARLRRSAARRGRGAGRAPPALHEPASERFLRRRDRGDGDDGAVCEHVHLPMQSGSSRMLKRMLRRYTREGYRECVERLRGAIPGLALTTDIIVGFPGETEEEFAETLEMVREIGFDDAYTFNFSAREGTPATRLPDAWTISDEVSSERLARLIATVRTGTRSINLGMLGTRHEVLVEKMSRSGTLLQARTRHHDGAHSRRRVDDRAATNGRAHGHHGVDVHRRRRADARRAPDGRMKNLLEDAVLRIYGDLSPERRARAPARAAGRRARVRAEQDAPALQRRHRHGDGADRARSAEGSDARAARGGRDGRDPARGRESSPPKAIEHT